MKLEFNTPFMEELLEQCLSNQAFQNWLVSNSIMHRVSVSPDALQFKEKSIESNNFAEKIVQLLWQYEGFLLPTSFVIQHIYGERNVDKNNEINAITAWCYQIRKRKLHDPNLLFNARGIGWAIGVSSLLVSRNSLLIMHRLWQDILQPVEENDLAMSVYGSQDQGTLTSLSRQISKLCTQELINTKAKITMQESDTEKVYQLTSRREKTKPPIEVIPSYLSQEFQDWLTDPGIGIIKLPPERPKGLLRRLNTQRKDHLLLYHLQKWWGYIVPYSYLSYLLYKTPDEIQKVKEIFSSLKDEGLLNSTDAFVLQDSGIGLGIIQCHATTKQLVLLHLLATGEQSLEQIIKTIYNSYNPKTEQNTFSLISKTRNALRSGKFTIAHRKENNHIIYYLTEHK